MRCGDTGRAAPGPQGRALRLLLAALLLTACSPFAQGPPPPHLILIVVDTLRCDHLATYGYSRNTSPNVDALAADAIRFDRAYATAPWTQASVASMITGMYPSSHGVFRIRRMLPKPAQTLAEVLREAGYATAGVVSHRLIGSRAGFDQGFGIFREVLIRSTRDVSGDRVTATAVGLLDRLAEQEKPFFLFVHYFDPHYDFVRHREHPFAPARAGRLEGGEFIGKLRLLEPPPTPEEIQFIRDLYDEEIRFTDHWIGVLLRSLKQRGLYDEALVVFTADHGEEFFERGWIGHTRTLYNELLRVPLLIRRPGERQPGRVVEEPVSLVDLAPTLLELLDIDPSGLRFQGGSFASLLKGEAGAAIDPVYAEVDFVESLKTTNPLLTKKARKRAVIHGRFKLIHDLDRDEYELYDLEDDPRERKSLIESAPETFAAMRLLLERKAKRAAGVTPAVEDLELSEAESRMLEELGYLSP